MHIVYTGEKAPNEFSKAIFLAGPTPRSPDVSSWRLEALRILDERGYDGVVFVPEDRTTTHRESYDDQVVWEHYGLEMADCIVFWVPRDLQTMPAFTTNIEFGMWMDSGKAIFGAPQSAPKNLYLKYCASKYFLPQAFTLGGTIDVALAFLGDGALRKDGERHVPLFIWNTPSFQAWYSAQVRVGNRLDDARVEWSFRIGPARKYVYCWALHVNVYVVDENRNKVNAVVISRPDISAVVMYSRAADPLRSKVVLVKEFRSTARTPDGFIHEVPSGSSGDPLQSPEKCAADEVFEETSLRLDPSRLKFEGSRQLAGTFSAHHAHVFSVELTDEEVAYLEAQKGVPHGLHPDVPSGERTYVEVKTVGKIISEKLVDWSTLGMIFPVINVTEQERRAANE